MESRNKDKAVGGSKAAEAVQQLLEQLHANGRSQDGSFANLRAQQEQKQRQTTRSGTQKQNKRPVAETSSAALARLNYEEAKARRMAAEADLARLEEGLKARKAPAEKDAKLSPPRLRESRTSGLNVQARTWEAPTSDALALKQARRALGDYRFNEMRKSKAMADLLDEVHARGGDSKDAIRVLEDYVNRKISKEEAEKKMEALKAEKKKDGKELSLAEREELVRLDIKHNQLMLQKLQLEKREHQRKEMEELQKKIRDAGLPVVLTKMPANPYVNGYGGGQLYDPPMYGGYADPQMYGDSQLFPQSPPFGGSGEDMFGAPDDFDFSGLESLPNKARAIDYGEELDGDSMLEAYQDPRTRRAGRGSSAHPLGRSATKPGYETLGTTGLPKFNMNGRASLPKRAQTVPGPGNFRLKPNDPRLDPRSSHYNVALARAYKEQQLKEAQHLQLVIQAEAERARKLERERQALEDERSRNLIDAQLYREKKLKEEARAKAAEEAARKAHEDEVAAKRQELDHVQTLEEIREQGEQLDYLEQLLTRNPRAAIPGLDPAKLHDDPNLLKHVLRLVEENIRKPEAARHSARLLQEAMQQEQANRERHAKLVRQEQELNRLEALLTQHPQATIRGLDMTKVNSDPNILAHALREVEEYIQRGENPIEIPINVPSVERLNEAHPRTELKEEERRLAQQFLSAAEDIQLAHLRSLPNPSSREFFLRMALHEADLAQAQEIVNRFRPLGFDIHIPPGAESRVRTPQPSRPPIVPVIVVEQAKSPPPTQDTGPSFPFPDMRTASGPPQTGASTGWQDKTRDASMPTPSPVAHNVIDEYSPSLPHLPTPPASTPGRTSAAHPSGAVAAAAAAAAEMAAELEKKAEEADLAAQEAELERERRELVEAEEAILRAEHEQALAEAQRRTDEEALAALQAQDEARAVAAAQMEEAAQEQARQMAAAQAAEEALWGAGDTHVPVEELGAQSPMMPTLPTPPLPSEELISGNDAWSSVAGDPVDEAPNIENDSAWDEAIAQVDANTSSSKGAKTASPATCNAASVKSLPASAHSTPKASRVGVSPAASIRSKVSSKPASSARQTPFASPKVPSMSTSPAALDAALSVRAASVKSPSVKAASPLAASVKAPSPAIEAVLSPAARSVRSEKALSPLSEKHASPPAASPTSVEKTVTPSQGKTHTPVPSVHSTPKAATPIIPKTLTPVQARELSPVLAKTPTPLASPVRSATSGAVTPKAATPAAALDAWGSPVKKPVSASGTPKVVHDAWESPVNKAVSTGGTPKAVSDAWGSPAVKAASPAGQASPARLPSVASPTKSNEAWGAASPARSVKAPSVAGPHKNNDFWGAASPARTASPRLQPRNSPAPAAGSEVFSPAKSQASKTGSGRSKVMSPAFGLDRGEGVTQIDPGEPEHVEGPKTAIKGSDPVVVSMVEPATPYEPAISQPVSGEPTAAGVATSTPPVGPDPNYPNEEYEDYSDEEEDDRPHVDPNFDPADFPIFMLHEPLDEGLTLLMDPPPHPFQEQYPKATPEVTVDGVLNHMATLAHAHGFHAIVQCACQDMGDSIIVQGYMAHLGRAEPVLSPGVGGPFDIPDKNAGKATIVSDASTPGF